MQEDRSENEGRAMPELDDEARLALAEKQLQQSCGMVISQAEFAMRRMPESDRLALIADLRAAYGADDFELTGPAVLAMLDRVERATYKAMPYMEYLATSHWRHIRTEAMERAEHQCQVCASTRDLQVHHRSYRNIGCESPADLTVLCDVCHSRHHGKRAA